MRISVCANITQLGGSRTLDKTLSGLRVRFSRKTEGCVNIEVTLIWVALQQKHHIYHMHSARFASLFICLCFPLLLL